MGCVASRFEEEEEVVSICRERKRQLKLAVERRYALADAHSRYCQSVYGVSAAINLFVARHSSPTSPFVITFPPPSPPKAKIVSNPLFLQQTHSEPNDKSAIDCQACASSTDSESEVREETFLREEEEEEEEEEERQQHQQKQQTQCHYHQQEKGQSFGYFYAGMPPPMPSPQTDFGWDFFDPFFALRPEMIGGYNRNSDDDLRLVREEEGIPDLEEEGERVEEAKNVVKKAAGREIAAAEAEKSGAVEAMVGAVGGVANVSRGLTVVDTPLRGRELLEALKDIEDYFTRVYDAGKPVSKMLEADRVHFQSGLEEIKESSTKLVQAITLQSMSSRSSSGKSLVSLSSKSSSTWTEFNNGLFDDCGGMVSGSHSLTLGRLYEWEKKLYKEVKAGDSTRRIYEKKCNQLRNQDARGEGMAAEKTRATVKDLYSRILVAIRSAESISERIDKLRDGELQAQIVELLHGLMNTWKNMSEAHEIQRKIISEVKNFTCPTYGKFSNNSHRLATLQLDFELRNWRSCFRDYVSAQRAYVESLHSWLSKFIVYEPETYSQEASGPPLFITCRDWLALIDNLPDKSVSCAVKSFTKDVRALWAQQGEEQQQKRRVDSLSKELERKVLSLQKNEEKNHADRDEDRAKGRRDMLDEFRSRVEAEREKHKNSMEETQRVTLNGFRSGFSLVFESLTGFSKASFQLYHDLVSSHENAEKLKTRG